MSTETPLTAEERDTLANAIHTDTETAYANPKEGVGDFAKCATVTAVESILSARLDALHAENQRLERALTYGRAKEKQWRNRHDAARADAATSRAERDALRDAAIDVTHIERQIAWSLDTFGPGTRIEGVLAHIRKELDEVAVNPDDVTEWADVLILALDGAWRAGHTPASIIAAVKAKQAVNEQREWPDWRTAPEGQPIEHIRLSEAGERPSAPTVRATDVSGRRQQND